MPVPYIFANTPSGASIPLSELNDTTTSKAMIVRVNYYGNLHQSATSPPEYILLNSNPSSGFTDIEANIYNNVFYGSSAVSTDTVLVYQWFIEVYPTQD